jgi:carbamoyltransferase
MYILGINAYHGDASAALIRDGRIVSAVEEERFNRRKHCVGFPAESVSHCLQAAGITIADVAHIGVSRDPSAHLHKKALYAATRAAQNIGGRDRSAGRPTETRGPGIFRQVADRLANAAKVRDLREDVSKALSVTRNSVQAKLHNVEHHRAHLASSFYVSSFERAALLSIDGFGDFISTMRALGEGNSIEILGQVEYPHSAGTVYTATTQFSGFPITATKVR